MYSAKLESGLSTTTVRHIHACLHAALEYGVRHGVVARNVADHVDAPQFARLDRIVLSADEAKRLLDSAKGTRWEANFVLALCTGLREGELLGLRWRFVDLECGTLTVAGNVQPGLNGLTLKEPKNAASARTLKLPELATVALREHQTRQAAEREKMGEHWHNLDLVFPTTVGTLALCQHFYKRVYRPLVAQADIPPIRFHDLRHGAATLLIAAGVPLPVVSQILGHSTIKVTADLYTHVNLAMQQPATDAMDALLGARV
jgi:integrase